MINLIKNELSKIFHKKAIYIIAGVTAVFALINFVLIKAVNNSSQSSSVDKISYQMIEQNLSSYNLNNAEELTWYVQDKTSVETFKEASKYEYNSWQFTKIMNDGYDLLYAVNEAEYIDKDETKLKEAKEIYDTFINDISQKDWKYFIEKEIEETENNIAIAKLALEETTNDMDKYKINKEIENLNYTLEGLNYRIKYNAPVETSMQSVTINSYVNYAQEYSVLNKDESTYEDKSELNNKRLIESGYYISKYRLENNVMSDSLLPANEQVASDFAGIIGFIVVVIAMISGTIVSEEYNKGTIKQLLLKPYTRTKILMSKYITAIIIFVLFLLFHVLLSSITYGLASGFNTLFEPLLIYNFSTHSVVEINLFTSIIMSTLALLPEYLILLTIAFFMSTVAGNSGLSITITLLIYFFSSIINALISMSKVKALSLFPTMCWDFTGYLYGGVPSYKYANFTTSMIVSIITFLVLFIIPIIVFKKKNIKNQ